MHDEIRKHLKECERDAFSPDNLGGDRYCAGAIRGALLSLLLTEAHHRPNHLIVELTKLRTKEAEQIQPDEIDGFDHYTAGILRSIDQVLRIVRTYAEASPILRGHSLTPYTDIRSRA
jgi:hypothetical protein